MFGRRDCCLLVLAQVAGLPHKHIAGLTVGDITVIDCTATITTRSGTTTALLPADDDPASCGACAVTR
jgi:hypothetical protein